MTDWNILNERRNNPLKVKQKSIEEEQDKEVLDPETGIITRTFYVTDPRTGDTIKNVVKVKRKQVKVRVPKVVSERAKNMQKFGEVANIPLGQLEKGVSTKSLDVFDFVAMDGVLEEVKSEQKMMAPVSGDTCRRCGGDHMTLACPKGIVTSASTKKVFGESYKKSSSIAELPCVKVDNLPKEVDRDQLRRIIEKIVRDAIRKDPDRFPPEEVQRPKAYGSRFATSITRSCKLLRDNETNESRGKAFVTMMKKEYADVVIERLNGYALLNCVVSVEMAMTERERLAERKRQLENRRRRRKRRGRGRGRRRR